MSRLRRVIYILASLFVVAVGGAIFMMANFKPALAQEALRFSIVETEGPREIIPGLSGPCSVESIAIENTSAVPFHVISVWITETETPGKAGIHVALAPEGSESLSSRSSVTMLGSILVPPKGTVYATSGVPLGGIASASQASLRVNVLSQSRANYFAGRALEWLHQHSPRFLKTHIPAARASLQQATFESESPAAR